MRAVLAEAVNAARLTEERVDPLSALRSQKAVLESMASSNAPMRYGEMLRCQEVAKRLPKANKEMAARWKKQAEQFNKVKKASKLKVGTSVGLPKLKLGWLDDEKNIFHMSERDMEGVPAAFEKMLVEIGEDTDILAFAGGSSKSLDDYVRIVLLQPELKDAEMNMSLDGLLSMKFGTSFDFVGAAPSEFWESLKKTLLAKMKARAEKAQL